jgi:hypothetical protein
LGLGVGSSLKRWQNGCAVQDVIRPAQGRPFCVFSIVIFVDSSVTVIFVAVAVNFLSHSLKLRVFFPTRRGPSALPELYGRRQDRKERRAQTLFFRAQTLLFSSAVET